MSTEHFVSVNGVDLHYTVEGRGPPLILLHGNGEDGTLFDGSARIMSEHFTVYRPDSRGHGRSSPVDEYHYSDMARDMHLFINELGMESPVFCGYSDGGIVGLMLASEHPGLLSRLIVCGANSEPSGLKGFFMFRCRHSKRMRADPKIRMMLEEPHMTAEDLGRIDVSTTVVAGGRDAVRIGDTRFIASSIPGSETVILKGETHSSYVEDAGRFAPLILRLCGFDTV